MNALRALAILCFAGALANAACVAVAIASGSMLFLLNMFVGLFCIASGVYSWRAAA